MTQTRLIYGVVASTLIITSALCAQPQRPNNGILDSKRDLWCKVWVRDKELKPDGNPEVIVTISNSSNHEVTITGLTIYLSPGRPGGPGEGQDEAAFAAPVNLETKSALEAKKSKNYTWYYPPTLLSVPAGQEQTLALDFSSLLFGRLKAAQLPSSRFRSVQAGPYQLFATMLVSGGKNELASNYIPVTVAQH